VNCNGAFVGTFEAGPFGNDTALDLLEELLDLDLDERSRRIAEVFEVALVDPADSGVPEQVVAAAAIVAVNMLAEPPRWALSLGEQVAIPSEHISAELCQSAVQALAHALPMDGWWWRSWVDQKERRRMVDMLGEVDGILRSHDDWEGSGRAG
jgi:AcrR family transcriptional regulator